MLSCSCLLKSNGTEGIQNGSCYDDDLWRIKQLMVRKVIKCLTKLKVDESVCYRSTQKAHDVTDDGHIILNRSQAMSTTPQPTSGFPYIHTNMRTLSPDRFHSTWRIFSSIRTQDQESTTSVMSS
ncbi:hypothetical protein TNCV_2641611 [Trichonephila clavipes]|nr:hypothetical protein TNCV_2641611 [Trichonephila clavipes]